MLLTVPSRKRHVGSCLEEYLGIVKAVGMCNQNNEFCFRGVTWLSDTLGLTSTWEKLDNMIAHLATSADHHSASLQIHTFYDIFCYFSGVC